MELLGQHSFLLLLLLILIPVSLCLAMPSPPIVLSVAGSDSGGGAGIQADLHAIQSFGCHGTCAVTCLTAQNSCTVTAVHTPPTGFFQEQLETVTSDLPPLAIKIGMLGTKELAQTAGAFLRSYKESYPRVKIVLDPVMISTSGSRLLDEDAQDALVRDVFSLADIITPNKYEAEALVGRTLHTDEDLEAAAAELLQYTNAVLIKGGHSSDPKTARDYLLTRSKDNTSKEQRCCDGGIWLESPRYDTIHTHGTGCTLSSSLAASLALSQSRSEGAYSSMQLSDACCLAKAYVSAGIQASLSLGGKGPGPVVHTEFPNSHEHFPRIVVTERRPTFASWCGTILPIVDKLEWIQRLCSLNNGSSPSRILDIQLRIKDETNPDRILDTVRRAQDLCQAANIRLWINDHWQAALAAGCFGVHLGQEDLYKCCQSGGLELLSHSGVALGLSTHSFAELSVALGLSPSYISLGPIFATTSKKVQFDPQGLETVRKWRNLIPPTIPLVVIGGIGDASTVASVRKAGADCVAVIGAVTQFQDASDIAIAVDELNAAMES